MSIFKIILSTILILSYSAICQADSVVITFTDGKTQTVALDGPIKSITAVKYLSAGDQTQAAPQAHSATSSPVNEAKKTQQQQPPAKPKVKFKWAAPIDGQ